MISLLPCPLDALGSSAFHLLFRTQQHTLSGFNWVRRREGGVMGTCGPCWSALSAPRADTTAGRKEPCATCLALSPLLAYRYTTVFEECGDSTLPMNLPWKPFCKLVDTCQR